MYSLRFHYRKSRKITEKIEKNLHVVNALLNSYDDSRDSIVLKNKELFLHKHNSYIYTRQLPIGRLYPRYTSINRLSREFRYILFKDLYHDIDIINAHPSILLQYTKKRGIDVPVLDRLVNDRNNLYTEVKNSYKNFPEANVKKFVLSAINNTRTDYQSPIMNHLGHEMVKIRSSLYEEFYLNDSDMRSAIDLRMNDNSLNTNDRSVVLNQKLQSLYCFNEETNNILLFKKWYENHFHERQEHSIIPFFDGLFINTKAVYKENLEELIDTYNATVDIKFAYKTIESDWEVYSDDVEYRKLKESIQQFDQLSSNEMEQLASKHGIDLKYGDLLTQLLDAHLEINESFSFSIEDVRMLQEITESKYNLLLDCFIKGKVEDNKKPKS